MFVEQRQERGPILNHHGVMQQNQPPKEKPFKKTLKTKGLICFIINSQVKLTKWIIRTLKPI